MGQQRWELTRRLHPKASEPKKVRHRRLHRREHSGDLKLQRPSHLCYELADFSKMPRVLLPLRASGLG